jgi:hypothetical protein
MVAPEGSYDLLSPPSDRRYAAMLAGTHDPNRQGARGAPRLEAHAREFEARKLERFRRFVSRVREHSPYYRQIIAERNIDVGRCVRATSRCSRSRS